MITVIICAVIVGGMWWSTQRKIKWLGITKLNAEYAEWVENRLELLAKDVMALQTKGKKKHVATKKRNSK